MKLDFSELKEVRLTADVCIIGAGAAGFSCALSLLNSNLQVLILEGGLSYYSREAADIHKGDIAGHKHYGLHEARERMIGGTTTTWGGQAYPFMKEDFEFRNHVRNSGWPINYNELKEYYKKAEITLGVDSKVSFDYNPWKEWKIEKPQFFPATIDLFVTKWCRIPNFAIQHGDAIKNSKNITLLSNANAIEINPNELYNEVKDLSIISLDGKKGTVSARYFIAAGGAIETVRLFLSSTKFGENGLGNENNLVGKYFQDHISAIVGQITPNSKDHFKNIFDTFYKAGFKYLPRIKLDPKYAEKNKLVHASAQIIFSNPEADVLNEAKTIFKKIRNRKLIKIKDLWKIIQPLKILQLNKALVRWKYFKRGTSSLNGPIWLEIHSEQEPIFTSKISLSDKVDQFGMKRVSLDWNISEISIQTIKNLALLVKREFEENNLANIQLETWVTKGSGDPRPLLHDTYHQSGGLRMALDKSDGVVDTKCKVFGIDNLYVASSAVFPTSSFSNPTMTTIALAIRISELVQKRCLEEVQVSV